MRRLRGAVGLEIGACLGQRQRSIGTTTDEVGIVVVLAVVLPIADRADLEPAALTQGEEAAARAAIAHLRRRLGDIAIHQGVMMRV